MTQFKVNELLENALQGIITVSLKQVSRKYGRGINKRVKKHYWDTVASKESWNIGVLAH